MIGSRLLSPWTVASSGQIAVSISSRWIAAMTLESQVNEGDAALAAGKVALANQLLALLDGYAAGEVDPRNRQVLANAWTTRRQASAYVSGRADADG